MMSKGKMNIKVKNKIKRKTKMERERERETEIDWLIQYFYKAMVHHMANRKLQYQLQLKVERALDPAR